MKSVIEHSLVAVVLVACIGAALMIFFKMLGVEVAEAPHFEEPAGEVGDYRDASYTIDGNVVALRDSDYSEVESVTSSNSVTKFFGNELFKDLDSDGRDDVVFLIIHETGGSGTFFYVVAALNKESGYIGSHAYFLGDRIAPQNIESGPLNQIVVNYADRGVDEPMSATPSIGVSKILILDIDSMQFGDVVSDFEGEANPDVMKLGMKKWVWKQTELNDGSVVKPVKEDVFTITFNEQDKSFSVTTDCNGAGGRYQTEADSMQLSEIFSTLMYCEGSQETEFLAFLGDVSGYKLTSRGELILILKYDSGSVVFK